MKKKKKSFKGIPAHVFSYFFVTSQSLFEEAAAAERLKGNAEELRCLPQTKELAVVAAVH